MAVKLRNLSSPVHWNVTAQTPNAVAYRLWVSYPGGDWEMIAEGGLADDNPDCGSFSPAENMQFAFWLGVGSTVPRSAFSISIVLNQDGVPLTNGVLRERGKLDDKGEAYRERTVPLNTLMS